VQEAPRLARIFRALSNPNRLTIYREILRNDETRLEVGRGCLVTEVARCLKIGAPTISHHVKELVNAGLVTAERQGRFLVCRINPKTRELARTALG
jgi:DNA-binding transcriptional ArsR family regulator